MWDVIRKDPRLSQTDLRVHSAGMAAVAGDPAHPNARKAMEERGLSLDHHVTSPLSKEAVDGAELLVALDEAVRAMMVASYPGSSQKMCVLAIADPYGYSIEAYRRCAQDILDSCMSRVLPLVRSLA